MTFLKRWKVARRQRKEEKIYEMVIAVETRKAAAIDWHSVQKCRYCERPLMVECQFCPHCGVDLSERQTTAQVKLVNLLPKPDTLTHLPQYSPSVTDLIEIAWQPEKQRLLHLYNSQIKPVKLRKR